MLVQSVIALFALLPFVASVPQVCCNNPASTSVLIISNVTVTGAGRRPPSRPPRLLLVRLLVRPTMLPPRLKPALALVKMEMKETILPLLPQSSHQTVPLLLPLPLPSPLELPLLLPPLEAEEAITGNLR